MKGILTRCIGELPREIARIEQKYPNPLSLLEIHEVLKDFKYIVPQGSPMTGIGNNFQIASLSNCFVIGNHGLPIHTAGS